MPSRKAMLDFIAREQECLWFELKDSIRNSISGRWSMGCSAKAIRILECADLVGPTHPDSVDWVMTAGGVYAELYKIAGIETPQWTEQQWAEYEISMRQYGGTREECSARYRPTILAMNEPGEKNYLARRGNVE